MKNITKLFATDHSLYEKPWLIVGKGPSYQFINDVDLSAYNVLALNHVISQINAKISHLIDIDVFETCAAQIYAQADYLVLPYYPHSGNQVGEFSLPNLLEKHPLLGKMDQEGRLFWYDHLGIKALLRHGKRPVRLSRQIRVSYFSAEAAVDILATQGIKSIRTLGIDGGGSYSQIFEQISPETRLANGNASFDNQFIGIISKISKYHLDYQSLANHYPIKVYVATQEEQMLSVKVLEYSIRKHASNPVEVFPLHEANIKYREPKDPRNKQRTPFSFQRFLIPHLNAHQGRAIYLDSDMQLFTDISQLWNLPMGSHDLLTVNPSRREKNRRLQFSVMLMDCEKLAWNVDGIIDELDAGRLTYESLMYDMAAAKNIGVCIPSEWNCLEWFKENKSFLVHYTDMPTQPWVSRDNKLGHLWINDLIEAVENGFIDIRFIQEHINNGWVRPSLMYQIENKVLSSFKLPETVCQLDENFSAPYKSL
ncbi:MAG: glycosyltransferase [Methylovulum sp.]|uniref:glycosyltransferase n=1 Tax=Methylovulum sp. TaxID=1916980 RepID=UPI00260860AE|nr:glycosyltransferase [Methylovulum sp.]MDD2725317.1 glycosyltransferase [Methylovulum sp.]MDD5125896.1 glycosyltransferase [Methylovulum sp.]